MQIVSIGESLYQIWNPVFWENKKNITYYLSSTELAQRVIKIE